MTVVDGGKSTVAETPLARRDGQTGATTSRGLRKVPRGTPSPVAVPGEVQTASAEEPLARAVETRDAARIAMYVEVSIPLAVVLALAAFFAGGDPLARNLHLLATAVFLIAAGAVRRITRRGEALSDLHHAMFGIGSVAAMASICYYWGSLSAAIMTAPMAMVVVGGGDKIVRTIGFSIIIGAMQLAFPLLIGLDVLADRTVVRPVDLSSGGLAALLLAINFGFVAAVSLGRRLRRADVATMQELHRAAAAVAARDALLAEAQEEIRRLREGELTGRYTEQEIGNYRLGKVVGRGAMGEVYEARHLMSGTRAAVKLLYPHVLAQPALFKRFARELEVVASLDAPNIVDVLEAPSPGTGGLPYLAMEFLEGSSLADVLDQRGTLSLSEVADLLLQISAGLQAAHATGIVHRDLKPQNLFHANADDGSSVWKILDFGVCKVGHHAGSLTSGYALGTPGYMAPEQAHDANVDHRADIYSLGVVAYRCVKGRPPLLAGYRHAPDGENAKATSAQPTVFVPAEVDDVLRVAMAQVPDHRFDSATDFARAFQSACSGTTDQTTSQRLSAVECGRMRAKTLR